jgi:ribosomal protein L37AE/L43A
MPTKPDQEAVETAKANADLASAHAETATETAETAEHAAADLEAKAHGTRACPTCNAPLVKHGDENPFKAGAWHCDNCGTCWAPGLKTPR